MPYDEFARWLVYLETRPAGWQDDLRAAYLMQALGVKKKPEEIFVSLAVMNENRKTFMSKNSNIYQKLSNAKGGDKLDILGQL